MRKDYNWLIKAIAVYLIVSIMCTYAEQAQLSRLYSLYGGVYNETFADLSWSLGEREAFIGQTYNGRPYL